MLASGNGGPAGCVIGAWMLLALAVLVVIGVAHYKRRHAVKCCAIGCKTAVKAPRLFCDPHWSKIPETNKLNLMESWDVDESGGVHKRGYDFYMATVRAINVIGIMEERISYEEAMHREEQSERTYLNKFGGGGQ